MVDSYDEQGNYIFFEGFDVEINEWFEGFEKQCVEWEVWYVEVECWYKMYIVQMEKFVVVEVVGCGVDDQLLVSSVLLEKIVGGLLVSDVQLVVLWEKFVGSV